MNGALQARSYEGTFVYSRGGHVQTLRITRIAGGDDDPGSERLLALTGDAWEVVREADRVTGVIGRPNERPDEKSRLPILTGHALRRGLAGAGPDLGDHYRIEAAGTDRVAGREAWVVTIDPDDRYRYAHRLWIDRETGLPLKTQLRDGEDVLERLMFTDMRPDLPEPEGGLETTLDGRKVVWERTPDGLRDPDRESIGEGRWEVTDPPDGFRLTFRNRVQEGQDGQEGAPSVRSTLEHLMYSDGLAHVSVYVAESGAVQPKRLRVGAMHAYHGPLQGSHVTIVGDVPPRTIERFASGLQRQ